MTSVHRLNVMNICAQVFENPSKGQVLQGDTICNRQTKMNGQIDIQGKNNVSSRTMVVDRVGWRRNNDWETCQIHYMNGQKTCYICNTEHDTKWNDLAGKCGKSVTKLTKISNVKWFAAEMLLL